MKWKNIQNGRTAEVLGDERVNNRPYRFFVYDDDPSQSIQQFDLLYATPAWEQQFAPLDSSVKV